MNEDLIRINELEREIENLQQQMQNEIVAIDGKSSLFMSQKKKDEKVSAVIEFYSKEIVKKRMIIEELSEDEDLEGEDDE